MTDASGTFQVTAGSEDTYYELDGGPKLARVSGAQRFAGDIEGDGSVEWSMCYLPDGTARFAGLTGEGTFDAPGGSEVSYHLEYQLG
jgi:hypothetical protein